MEFALLVSPLMTAVFHREIRFFVDDRGARYHCDRGFFVSVFLFCCVTRFDQRVQFGGKHCVNCISKAVFICAPLF